LQRFLFRLSSRARWRGCDWPRPIPSDLREESEPVPAWSLIRSRKSSTAVAVSLI